MQGGSVIISGTGGPPVASVTPQTSELVGDFVTYTFVLVLHSGLLVLLFIITIKAISLHFPHVFSSRGFLKDECVVPQHDSSLFVKDECVVPQHDSSLFVNHWSSHFRKYLSAWMRHRTRQISKFPCCLYKLIYGIFFHLFSVGTSICSL